MIKIMKMKNIIYNIFLLVSLMFVACEPVLEDAPDIGAAPTVEDLSFTIEQGADDFTFVFTNTSTITGIAQWDLGNGQKATGNEVKGKFVLPDTYAVTLTLLTSGGSAVKAENHVTTKTDYSIFTDPLYINLSGGIEVADGKVWVVDSITKGHFGIGPAGGTWPEWWSADPLAKPSSGAYDDEFVFKIDGFSFDFNNNGNSYVKDFQKDNANYSNLVALYGEPDCRVNYTPAAATWSIVTKDGADYIVFSSPTPTFFGFDYGAAGSEFRIDVLTENTMDVSCIGGDGNRWHNKLIVKGYAPPVTPPVTYTAAIVELAVENTWEVSLSDVVVPDGNGLDSYSVDFGDGSEVSLSEDYTVALEHTYMRKGTYPVIITANTLEGDVIKTLSVTIEDYHSTYVPFLLDYMVMFVDNSEVEMTPMAGEDCDLTVVDNPDRIYPNKGVNVFHYKKDGQQWANANMILPAGYRFNLTKTSVFRIMVRGKAGQAVLLKLENTDKGGNAWQTGAELTYTIKADDTWEVAEYDFAGVAAGFDWTGDIYTSDIATDSNFNNSFYNIIRIMLNPGVGEGVHEFHFDDLAGPHVEGLKSARL